MVPLTVSPVVVFALPAGLGLAGLATVAIAVTAWPGLARRLSAGWLLGGLWLGAGVVARVLVGDAGDPVPS